MYKYLIIFTIFLLGIYFYSCHGQKVVEGFDSKRDCPNILIQKGNDIYLYNSKLAKIPGRNPIRFNNLDDYIQILTGLKFLNLCIFLIILYFTSIKLIKNYIENN